MGTTPTDRSLWSRLGNSRRVGNDVTIVVSNDVTNRGR